MPSVEVGIHEAWLIVNETLETIDKGILDAILTEIDISDDAYKSAISTLDKFIDKESE
jgi:hypothetical protein